MSMQNTRQTRSLTILFWLLVIQGLSMLAAGSYGVINQGWLALIQRHSFYDYLPFVIPTDFSYSGLVLLLSLLLLLIGISVCRLKPWAWTSAMTLQGISLLSGLILYLNQRPNYPGMASSIVIVFYLNLSDVQEVLRG